MELLLIVLFLKSSEVYFLILLLTLSMVLYLAMGWGIVFRFNLLPEAVGMSGIYLLVAGGLAYTIGTIFYGLQNKHRYMHSIWHLWILLGSALHFLCIILYVI